MQISKIILAAVVFSAATNSYAQARFTAGNFSAGSTEGWKTAGFDDIPASQYELVTVDGKQVIRGRCKNSASVFGFDTPIDLNATPIMHWSWRVDKVYSGLNEKTKAGDDYVARVYAIIDGGILKWRTRAINYVWASSAALGKPFANPYRDELMMVPMRTGTREAGRWHEESRNVQADFRKFYDRAAEQIDGIALMTDCDNHDGRGEAYFGDIYFTAQ